MKKRRPLLYILLVLLVFVGTPILLTLRAISREQASRALIHAILDEDTPAALSALDRGADPNAREHPEKPLSFVERLQLLFVAPFHSRDRHQENTPTTLILLCRAGFPLPDGQWEFFPPSEHPDLLKTLLEHGAEPNSADDTGYTPLILATRANYPLSVSYLLQHGADVNARDPFGDTPLFLATFFGNDACTRLLLQHGADVDAQNNDGVTTLMIAATRDDSELVSLLIAHHADMTLRDKAGRNALRYAQQTSPSRSAAILKQVMSARTQTTN